MIHLYHDGDSWFIEADGEVVWEGGTVMCGRFNMISEDDVEEMRRIVAEIDRRYQDTPERAQMRSGEIFPTNVVPALAHGRSGNTGAFLMKWGFKSFKGSSVIINARSETAQEKPMFAQAMRERRCVIPAQNYYEWEGHKLGKQKYAIRAAGGSLCYMAGIYRYQEDARLPVFVILTRPASPEVRFIHDRMPVLVSELQVGEWLNAIDGNAWLSHNALTHMQYEMVQ